MMLRMLRIWSEFLSFKRFLEIFFIKTLKIIKRNTLHTLQSVLVLVRCGYLALRINTLQYVTNT
jgi:hypothetical protein